MIGVLLAMTLAADPLATSEVQGLSLKLPSAWSRSDTDDGVSLEEKKGDAQLELSVFAVDPKRTPRKCMAELKEKIGEGFEDIEVGGEPAARKVVLDTLGEPDAGAKSAKVSSVTYVGCNGSTKWVLTLSSQQSQSARFGVLIKKIISSLKYPH